MVDHAAGEFTQVLFEDVAFDPSGPPCPHQLASASDRPRSQQDLRRNYSSCPVTRWPSGRQQLLVAERVVDNAVGEFTQVLFEDVASDPTLPRTKPVCEVVFFQATASEEEGMTLFFVCCNPNCGHRRRD
ncbi:DNA-directed RNA polymerases II, IV and V subunit 9B-like [Panicum miliaceum]|uniref:DNA-directed RNA polymerases II, IV and V subunit 9B-like n=1 Tax=Panicum miliaceum TaxID=4540 RepID=A0A3L6TNQ4_PANMI|nr:DNA-directed RNA polymerases II, IV and V subunit 9B-like [Panicum miliaceum]